MPTNRIKTRLAPEVGLAYEHDLPARFEIDEHVQRALAYLVGKTSSGTVLLEATSGGSLKVASTGAGFESYTPYTGTTVDAYAAGQTHEYATPADEILILVETNDVIASFKNAAGLFGADVIFPKGVWTWNVLSYGVKFKARVAASQGFYQAVIAN